MPDLDALAQLNGAAEAIWLASSSWWPGLTLDVLPEATSTNTLLMDRGRGGDTTPALVVALQQTAGRGRQGRSWQAQAGRTLTFSLGLPLNLSAVPRGGSALSLVVGATLAQALQDWLQPATPLGLKWPNDLLWQGRKLGGILIEATATPGLPDTTRWVVIGVGLNIALPQSDDAPRFAALTQVQPAWHPDALNVGSTWQCVAPALLLAVHSFATQGFAPWRDAYARHDVLAGHPVTLLQSPGQTVLAQGTAQGVDADGALLVHTAKGTERWTSGEVSVRSADWPHWSA